MFTITGGTTISARIQSTTMNGEPHNVYEHAPIVTMMNHLHDHNGAAPDIESLCRNIYIIVIQPMHVLYIRYYLHRPLMRFIF